MTRSTVLSTRSDARAAGGALVGGSARVGAGGDSGTAFIILGVLGLGLVVAGLSPRKGW